MGDDLTLRSLKECALLIAAIFGLLAVFGSACGSDVGAGNCAHDSDCSAGQACVPADCLPGQACLGVCERAREPLTGGNSSTGTTGGASTGGNSSTGTTGGASTSSTSTGNCVPQGGQIKVRAVDYLWPTADIQGTCCTNLAAAYLDVVLHGHDDAGNRTDSAGNQRDDAGYQIFVCQPLCACTFIDGVNEGCSPCSNCESACISTGSLGVPASAGDDTYCCD